MINETLQAIFSRRSIRRFSDDPLTADQLDDLKAVALASPTGMNRQSWHFSFVMNTDKIAAVSEGALAHFRQDGNQAVVDRMAARHKSLFYGAPLVVFISLPQGDDAELDAGIAAANLAVAAQSMGLGSCIIGLAAAAFNGTQADEMKRLIAMPDGHEFAISIAIGHPAMTKEAHEQHPEKITVIG